MGRPPKEPSLLLNQPLRVMVTADQKALIEEAARLEGVDVAAWVRPVLLEAARRRVARAGKSKRADRA